jgi:hypothetical protein
MISLNYKQNKIVNSLGGIGLIAKGIVYLAMGALAFMAAFELAGHDEKEASRKGVFEWLQATGGSFLLILISAGLAFYCIWRFVQAFTDKSKKPKERLRYFFSGLAYSSVAFTAAGLALHKNKKDGDGNQHWVSEALNKPYGELIVGIGALIFVAIGIYQLYYGLSGKYKKHVDGLNLQDEKAKVLLKVGKVGYISRGLVWLLLSFLLARAAWFNKASEAGDTGKAFRLVENESYGSYILGAIGIGLIAYGIFNLVRAKYGSR